MHMRYMLALQFTDINMLAERCRTFRAALAHAKGCPVKPKDLVRARDGAPIVGIQYLQEVPCEVNNLSRSRQRTPYLCSDAIPPEYGPC